MRQESSSVSSPAATPPQSPPPSGTPSHGCEPLNPPGATKGQRVAGGCPVCRPIQPTNPHTTPIPAYMVRIRGRVNRHQLRFPTRIYLRPGSVPDDHHAGRNASPTS